MNRCFMLAHPECIMAVKSKRATRSLLLHPLPLAVYTTLLDADPLRTCYRG